MHCTSPTARRQQAPVGAQSMHVCSARRLPLLRLASAVGASNGGDNGDTHLRACFGRGCGTVVGARDASVGVVERGGSDVCSILWALHSLESVLQWRGCFVGRIAQIAVAQQAKPD